MCESTSTDVRFLLDERYVNKFSLCEKFLSECQSLSEIINIQKIRIKYKFYWNPCTSSWYIVVWFKVLVSCVLKLMYLKKILNMFYFSKRTSTYLLVLQNSE